MGESKLHWSYLAGEKRRNRVRAFVDAKSGILMLEFLKHPKYNQGFDLPKRPRQESNLRPTA